jgi:hypothetical protein
MFSKIFRAGRGLTQTHLQWVEGVGEWSGLEAHHSPSHRAKIRKVVELYLHSLTACTLLQTEEQLFSEY